MMNNSPSTNNNVLVIKKRLFLDFNHNHSAFSRESQPFCTESQKPCASMSPVTVYPDFCGLYIYIYVYISVSKTLIFPVTQLSGRIV